ncbi:MAG: glucodextranase DOMON-like domain-containing protein [Deinococcales bacterium]
MIHLLVLAVAALHLQDPAGDAVGDGSLAPPTAPVYANTADFDLQSVALTDASDLTVRVTLGALPDPGKLPNGFSNPIIEVYLDTAAGGAQQLLPGSGMAMPPKHGWNIALRATGDEAFAVEAKKQGSPSSWPRLPVKVEVQGNTITLQTNLKRPEHATLYALTGVYDPFTKDGWRPLSTSVSPWAFSSPTQQAPVVDLLASNQASQRRQIDSGVLAPYRSATHGIGWLLLMVLGLIVAAGGLVLRRRVRAPVGPGAAPPPGSAPDEGPEVYERFLNEEEEAALWPDADGSVDRAIAAADRAPIVEDTAEQGTAGAAGESTASEDRAGDDRAGGAAPGGRSGPTAPAREAGDGEAEEAPDQVVQDQVVQDQDVRDQDVRDRDEPAPHESVPHGPDHGTAGSAPPESRRMAEPLDDEEAVARDGGATEEMTTEDRADEDTTDEPTPAEPAPDEPDRDEPAPDEPEEEARREH